ncbi:MAG: YbaN family protein [Clostridiales bacterium]|nr:YbaN family protein [Clostridiales bacterium]
MVKRIILVTLGFAALGLGGIGLFLPILPTTPFVLCAAGCFGASYPALGKKLENTRYFGEYVKNYRNKSGISKKARLSGLVFLWLTLGISAALVRKPLVMGILAVVGICVSIHILLLKRSGS